MNFSTEMIPGLAVLLAGALLAFGAGAVCRKKENVPQVKMLGVALAFVGAILVFIP